MPDSATFASNVTVTVTVNGEEYEGKLARIERTSLGYEDHGIPTAFLHCAGHGWGQGAGGFHLGGAAMHAWVMGVIDALGCETWENLPGRSVMLLYKKGTGHYPVEGVMSPTGEKTFLFRPAMEAVKLDD